MRYAVRWRQSVEHAVEIDVDEATVAAWAAGAVPLRALRGDQVAPASAAMILQSMDANPHMRDRLIQLWAAAHAIPTDSAPRVDAIDVNEPDAGREEQ